MGQQVTRGEVPVRRHDQYARMDPATSSSLAGRCPRSAGRSLEAHLRFADDVRPERSVRVDVSSPRRFDQASPTRNASAGSRAVARVARLLPEEEEEDPSAEESSERESSTVRRTGCGMCCSRGASGTTLTEEGSEEDGEEETTATERRRCFRWCPGHYRRARAGSPTASDSSSEPSKDMSWTMSVRRSLPRAGPLIRSLSPKVPAFDRSVPLKAAGVALVGFLIAYLVQRPPDFVMRYFEEVRVNMTETVAEYPESFAAPHQYDPTCDTHSQDFRFGNREHLEGLGDFSFVMYLSAAGLFNMLCDTFKALTAVLMQPVAIVPSADEFEYNEVHPVDLSLRRSPTNHFVTLGNLVPEPDMLWSSNGKDTWGPTEEAKQLVELVARSLPDGSRRVGAEFSPLESVNELMKGPHFVDKRSKLIILPWNLQTAWLFFPIQFTQLIWELVAESFVREPSPAQIVLDLALWQKWVRLSFRHEVCVPALLRLLRCCISVHNLKACYRGDPDHEALSVRIALTTLLLVVALPQLLVYLPAIAAALLAALGPTLAACHILKKIFRKTYWQWPFHHHMPSMLVSVPCGGISAFFTSHVFRFLSADTYICTHSKAMLVPIHSGHVLINAPIVFFAISMLCCAVAVAVPIWMLRRLAPGRMQCISRRMSAEYIYMQWLRSPVYDGRALRTDEVKYTNHKNLHFFKGDPQPTNCVYCAHLREDKMRLAQQPGVPVQAVLFTGRGLPWEPPCLSYMKDQMQRGEVCSAEFRLAISAMRANGQPEEFDRVLAIGADFMDGLVHAEALRHRICAPCGGGVADGTGAVDGHWKSMLRSLQLFLERTSGQSLGQQGTPTTHRNSSRLPSATAEALQRYLQEERFYRDALNGDFSETSIRSLQAWLAHEGFALDPWMRDKDGHWGDATTVSLQKFLKKEEAGYKWKATPVDGEFRGKCVSLLHEFLSDQGELSGSGICSKTWTKRSACALKHFLRRRGYLSDPCGEPTCRQCNHFKSETARVADDMTQTAEELAYFRSRTRRTSLTGTDENKENFRANSGRRDPWTTAMQEWLRDEGFPTGLGDELSNLWDSATTMALQQFLNSQRSEPQMAYRALSVDGDMNIRTVHRLREFLTNRLGKPQAMAERPWDSTDKRMLQTYLKQRSHYPGNVDGTFESLSEKSLQAWLTSEGFPPQLPEEGWDKSSTKSLQMFLNSSKASTESPFQDVAVSDQLDTHTIVALQRFLLRSGENPGAVDGDFGRETRRALQAFLVAHGYETPCDGQRSEDTAQALQRFLEDAGFLVETMGGFLSERTARVPTMSATDVDLEREIWAYHDYEEEEMHEFNRKQVIALQVFLNSPRARQTGSSRVHEGICWSLALFGGAEKAMPPGALEAVEWLSSAGDTFSYVDEGRKTAKARTKFRKAIDSRMAVCSGGVRREAWWGTAELLRCLGDDAWIEGVGSRAVAAALGALRSLESAEEAKQGTFKAGVATLLGCIRNSGAGVIVVVGESLAAALTEEEAEDAVCALADRLRRDSSVADSACRALLAFGPAARPHFSALVNLVGTADSGGALQRAVQAIGVLVRLGGLTQEDAGAAARKLSRRFKARASEDDWMIRVFACRALPSLGEAARQCQEDLLGMIHHEDEGIVLRTASEAVGELLGQGIVGQDLAAQVASVLAQRMEHSADKDILLGACEGLGYLGEVSAPYTHKLLEKFRSTDMTVAYATGMALAALWESGVLSEEDMQRAKQDALRQLDDDNLQARLAGCAGIGALGSKPLGEQEQAKLMEDLRRVFENEDETGLVRTAAREALAQLSW